MTCTCTNPNHNHGACSIEEIANDQARQLRLCPTCGATMIPAGKHAYICPNQKDQGNGISAELRAAVLDTASKRVDIAPF